MPSDLHTDPAPPASASSRGTDPASGPPPASALGACLVATVGAVALAAVLWGMMYWASYRSAPRPGEELLKALAAAAPAGAESSAPGGAIDPEAVSRGRERFALACTACHGPNGEAKPGLGKDLAHSTFIAGLTDEEFMAFVKRGRPVGDPLNTTNVDMPPKGGNPALSDAQLSDIIAYVRALQAIARAEK